MAMLDKTFPTNDCSMCIESPKFVECYRHPNIEIISYVEVMNVEGEAGKFKITLVKKPRYVSEDKCTGCTTCVEYCPVEVPAPFNQGFSPNKAIHMYFAQAIPLVTYIDEDCLYLRERKCRICEQVCRNAAIDFAQKPKLIEIKVGAVILAPGLEPYDPAITREYGYGRIQNVVTSLEYERILCATGPYEGEIRRASDLRHPHTIAWIHCVGSRRLTPGNNSYCSAVCCTYTQKQVILTKEHDPEAECVIFHNDIRSYGKDFERFYQRAAAYPGVRFIRCHPSIIGEDDSKNVIVRYATGDNGVKEDRFDMVVLSVGLNPLSDADELAGKFGIELDTHGFCKTNPFNPIKTTRPGIFVSGVFQGPKDIPESVVMASAAGATCGELLGYRRGKLATERVYPLERDVRREDPKVGVFVCHCGTNIGRVVDILSVVECARSLPNVVHVEEQLFSCSSDSNKRIAEVIEKKGLNRVIVAACTPRTHKSLFQETLQACGLNKYLFEMANIWDQDSWVHGNDPKAATEKAKDLVRMAVARAELLRPLKEKKIPINRRALVMGGGVAGMNAALGLANQGFETVIVEKEPELGGLSRQLSTTIEGADIQKYLDDLIKEVMSLDKIQVLTNALVVGFGGFQGNFTTEVLVGPTMYERKINHGVAIIATGAREYTPKEFLYGQDERVITQIELDRRIEEKGASDLHRVVMIQCVGSRNEENPNCSRICCQSAIKNALHIKSLNSDTDVWILYRDIRTYGLLETYYAEARRRGVKFIRFDKETPPIVESGAEGLTVMFKDHILKQDIRVLADLVVLSAGMVAQDTEELATIMKLPLNQEGYFMEAHVKLRPVDMASEGIFVCGTAHGSKLISETISQSLAAASRATTFLSQSEITLSAVTARVDEDRCAACLICVRSCPYGVPKVNEKGVSEIDEALCHGCGICVAECPAKAITLNWYEDDQIMTKVDALLEGAYA